MRRWVEKAKASWWNFRSLLRARRLAWWEAPEGSVCQVLLAGCRCGCGKTMVWLKVATEAETGTIVILVDGSPGRSWHDVSANLEEVPEDIRAEKQKSEASVVAKSGSKGWG